MVDRREFLAGVAGVAGLAGYSALPGQEGDEMAQMLSRIDRLEREIKALNRNTPKGDKIRRRADGTLALGDVPIIIEGDGFHFKDVAYGDGLFWDGSTYAAQIQGQSGSTTAAYLRLQATGSGGTLSLLMAGRSAQAATWYLEDPVATTVFQVYDSMQIVSDGDTSIAIACKRGAATGQALVYLGANDSGGAGYRLLRVPN